MVGPLNSRMPTVSVGSVWTGRVGSRPHLCSHSPGGLPLATGSQDVIVVGWEKGRKKRETHLKKSAFPRDSDVSSAEILQT